MAKKKGTPHFEDFDIYLDWVGAERMALTNPYEIHRFASNEIVCVIYQGKRGVSFSNDESKRVYEAFLKKVRINILGTKRKRFSQTIKMKLFQRDGGECFYTGVDLTADTASIEHLIPLSKGGKNNLDNLVLCAEDSNKLMADKPLIEKVKFREQNLYRRK